MTVIDKQELVDDLLIIATTKNTMTIKEIYELIRQQKTITVIEVRRL